MVVAPEEKAKAWKAQREGRRKEREKFGGIFRQRERDITGRREKREQEKPERVRWTKRERKERV